MVFGVRWFLALNDRLRRARDSRSPRERKITRIIIYSVSVLAQSGVVFMATRHFLIDTYGWAAFWRAAAITWGAGAATGAAAVALTLAAAAVVSKETEESSQRTRTTAGAEIAPIAVVAAAVAAIAVAAARAGAGAVAGSAAVAIAGAGAIGLVTTGAVVLPTIIGGGVTLPFVIGSGFGVFILTVAIRSHSDAPVYQAGLWRSSQ